MRSLETPQRRGLVDELLAEARRRPPEVLSEPEGDRARAPARRAHIKVSSISLRLSPASTQPGRSGTHDPDSRRRTPHLLTELGLPKSPEIAADSRPLLSLRRPWQSGTLESDYPQNTTWGAGSLTRTSLETPVAAGRNPVELRTWDP